MGKTHKHKKTQSNFWSGWLILKKARSYHKWDTRTLWKPGSMLPERTTTTGDSVPVTQIKHFHAVTANATTKPGTALKQVSRSDRLTPWAFPQTRVEGPSMRQLQFEERKMKSRVRGDGEDRGWLFGLGLAGCQESARNQRRRRSNPSRLLFLQLLRSAGNLSSQGSV